MEILDIVVHAICEKKAQDVRVYDVTSLTPFMDSMIVCSTTNIRQNNAIAQNIKDRLREAGYPGKRAVQKTVIKSIDWPLYFPAHGGIDR